jgi:hypothetical protein
LIRIKTTNKQKAHPLEIGDGENVTSIKMKDFFRSNFISNHKEMNFTL